VVARIAALVLRTYLWVTTREFPRSTVSNLGAAGRDAKGTAGDYLTHPNAIPVEKMAFQLCFPAVVKTTAGNMTAATPFMFSSACAQAQA
jgi:hypothetical protein